MPPLRLLSGLTAVASGALLALMLKLGYPADPQWWLVALPMMAWAMAPVVAPWLVARRRRRMAVPAIVAFLPSAAFATWSYGQAFFQSESSTAALAFIFVPIWQWGILLSVGGIAALVLALKVRRTR